MQDLSFEVALKRLAEEGRPISPAALAGLLSTLLYSRRGSPFFVEPIVAGLSAGGKPYLCGQVRARLGNAVWHWVTSRGQWLTHARPCHAETEQCVCARVRMDVPCFFFTWVFPAYYSSSAGSLRARASFCEYCRQPLFIVPCDPGRGRVLRGLVWAPIGALPSVNEF